MLSRGNSPRTTLAAREPLTRKPMSKNQELTEGESIFLAALTIALLLAWKVAVWASVVWVSACVGLAIFVSRRKQRASDEQRMVAETAEANRRVELRNAVRREVNAHADTLRRKRRQLVRVGDYGDVDASRWHAEIAAFAKAKAGREMAAYSVSDDTLIDWVEADLGKDDEPVTFDEQMTGVDYEGHCADLLQKAGWDVRPTVASGDQGVDLIAEKQGLRVALQCKRYSQPVGNKAVQEAHAGKGFAGAAHAVVVSNATYTRAAQDLARALGVVLMHHEELAGLEAKLARAPATA